MATINPPSPAMRDAATAEHPELAQHADVPWIRSHGLQWKLVAFNGYRRLLKNDCRLLQADELLPPGMTLSGRPVIAIGDLRTSCTENVMPNGYALNPCYEPRPVPPPDENALVANVWVAPLATAIWCATVPDNRVLKLIAPPKEDSLSAIVSLFAGVEKTWEDVTLALQRAPNLREPLKAALQMVQVHITQRENPITEGRAPGFNAEAQKWKSLVKAKQDELLANQKTKDRLVRELNELLANRDKSLRALDPNYDVKRTSVEEELAALGIGPAPAAAPAAASAADLGF